MADPVSTASPAMPRLFSWMLRAAGLMALGMMAITFCDVTMRYVFGSPIMGAFEITEILMGLMVFTAAPAMTWAGENIAVTLLTERLPVGWQRWLQAAGDLVCGLGSAAVAVQLWRHGARLLRYGETTMELHIPRGAVAQVMAVGMAVTALAFLWRVWRAPAPATHDPAAETV